MKKIFSCMAIAALVGMGMTSCNNQPQKNDTKAAAPGTPDGNSEGKIAYVEMDTIMSQYKFWQDVTKEMQQKETNANNTLKGKQESLQQAAASFQQRVQQNKFQSQEEYNRAQSGIQQQAQEADALQQRLAGEYQELAAQYNQALMDSVNHFLAEYNKTKKYSLIVPKGAILYGDKGLDITNDVVAGLNKAYKGLKK